MLGILSGQTDAEIIFSDNFNTEPVPTFEHNYTGFANWTVTSGTVDILDYDLAHWPASTSGGWSTSDGLLVDMDGSTNSAGTLETKQSYTLETGIYELAFYASGNLRVPWDDTLQVEVGTVYSENHVLSKLDSKALYSAVFTVTSAESAKISFQNLGGDNAGVFLDSVQLTAIPEPTAISLSTIVAFGLFARYYRRRIVSKNIDSLPPPNAPIS